MFYNSFTMMLILQSKVTFGFLNVSRGGPVVEEIFLKNTNIFYGYPYPYELDLMVLMYFLLFLFSRFCGEVFVFYKFQ